jgi:hypothetical protein
MAGIYEIVQKVEAFLANVLSLQEFEDWSAEFSWDIHKRADANVQDLAYRVRAILNAFSDEESESGLREELAEAVRPFAQPATGNCIVLAPCEQQSNFAYILSVRIRSGSALRVHWCQRERSAGNRDAVTQSEQLMYSELFHEDVDRYYQICSSRCAASA